MQDRSPSLLGVASQVDSLLRKYDAVDYFRDRVREAAQEHIAAMAECERRKKLRREAAAKVGVLSLPLDDEVVKEKTKEGYFFWSEEFRGRINVPPDVTEPLMPLTHGPQFPNRPAVPRCRSNGIPRDDWSEDDEREVAEFNKGLMGWDMKRSDYVTATKEGGPSKWEEDQHRIFELAKTRNFPDDGDGGFPYTFIVEAWLPGNLSEDNDPATDGPLPVSKKEEKTLLNSKYAGLAAICDAHWGGSERIAPWRTVKFDGKLNPASGLPREWQTPEEPDSYRAASWYWRLVRTAKELDYRNTTMVDSWLADVEADLAKAFPNDREGRRANQRSPGPVVQRSKRTPNGPNIERTKALFFALLSMLPQEEHAAITSSWSANDIRTAMADKLKLDPAPTQRTIQRMLVAEGYRQPKSAKPVSGDYDGTHWDDRDDPRQRQVR